MKRILFVVIWALVMLTAYSQQREFSDSVGRQPATTHILANLPSKAARQAARGYLRQLLDMGPSVHRKAVLEEFLTSRRAWLSQGGEHLEALKPFLSSKDAWERYLAAILIGGTRAQAAQPLLLGQLAREGHRDVRYALEAALAETGQHPLERARSLLRTEMKERANQGVEARRRRLVRLIGNIHRKEVLPVLAELKAMGPPLGEVAEASEYYLKADLGI